MTFSEIAISIEGDDQFQVGVLAKPDVSGQTGVIVLVGGPQYRAGSHRQFVLLSRALAEAGFAVLRMDFRGMGDSDGEPYQFTNVSTDIACAISAFLTQVPTLRHIVLWGLCDGASAALLYLHDTKDARVVGLCLLNPWVRSETTLARTQVKHYYSQRLRQREFWVKLASGKVAASALKGLINSLRAMGRTSKHHPSADLQFQEKMQIAWSNFRGSMLLVLSGEDYTAKEFLEYAQTHSEWTSALQQSNVHRHDINNADHTFSAIEHSREVEIATVNWLAGLKPGNGINETSCNAKLSLAKLPAAKLPLAK